MGASWERKKSSMLNLRELMSARHQLGEKETGWMIFGRSGNEFEVSKDIKNGRY